VSVEPLELLSRRMSVQPAGAVIEPEWRAVIAASIRSPATTPSGWPTVSEDDLESVAEDTVERQVIVLSPVRAGAASVVAYVEPSHASIALAGTDGPIAPRAAATASETTIVRGRHPNTWTLSAAGGSA
jgi:hypothetical protein